MNLRQTLLSLGIVLGLSTSSSIEAQIDKASNECWNIIKSNNTSVNVERDEYLRIFVETHKDFFCDKLKSYSEFRFYPHGKVVIGTTLHYYEIINGVFQLYLVKDENGDGVNTDTGLNEWKKRNNK